MVVAGDAFVEHANKTFYGAAFEGTLGFIADAADQDLKHVINGHGNHPKAMDETLLTPKLGVSLVKRKHSWYGVILPSYTFLCSALDDVTKAVFTDYKLAIAIWGSLP